MSEIDLDGLEALAARVDTARPWYLRGNQIGVRGESNAHYVATGLDEADGALIVAAVSALPSLIAEVRRLRAENADLRAKAVEAHAATHCDCGNELSRGYCNPCDNDE